MNYSITVLLSAISSLILLLNQSNSRIEKIKNLVFIYPTYANLVSRGSYGNGECWGDYNSILTEGWGSGFGNPCIHSGSIKTSGDLPTSWYNYPLASAGSIVDKNTSSDSPANNTAKATESICPKGWTLPSSEQISSNRDVRSFFPVLGGYYSNSSLITGSVYGLWWSSEANNKIFRVRLGYYDGVLHTNGRDTMGLRFVGNYIRCVPAP